MTRAAREVLEDSRVALAGFSDGIQGREWRVKWISAVVLLRAVGHVLDKVDGDNNDSLALAIQEAWRELQSTKPEPAIFWQFINDERNNILKEYLINAGQGVTVNLGSVPPHVTYHYVINSGPFAGREQRQLIGDAIDWWQCYLDRVDQLAAV